MYNANNLNMQNFGYNSNPNYMPAIDQSGYPGSMSPGQQPIMPGFPGGMNQGQPMPLPSYPSCGGQQPIMPGFPGGMNQGQPMPLPSYPSCGGQQPIMPGFPGGMNPGLPMPLPSYPSCGCQQPMPLPSYPGCGCQQPMPLPSYPGCGGQQPMPLPSYPSCGGQQPMPLPSYPDCNYPCQPTPIPTPTPTPEQVPVPLSNYQTTYSQPYETTTNYKKTTYIEAVVPVQSDVPLMQPTVQKKITNSNHVSKPTQQTNNEDYDFYLIDENMNTSYKNKERNSTSREKANLTCENLPLATGYVRPQTYKKLNQPEQTLEQGTIFSELYQPYTIGGLK